MFWHCKLKLQYVAYKIYYRLLAVGHLGINMEHFCCECTEGSINGIEDYCSDGGRNMLPPEANEM